MQIWYSIFYRVVHYCIGRRNRRFIMEEILLKYGLLGIAAVLSGFFLVGFFIYTIYAVIHWFTKKTNQEKMWGGLVGVVLNGLIFVLTFPKILPFALDAINKVLVRFL